MILLACIVPFVVIVGILAAIAIPAYQDYTIRAQVSEGLNLAAGPKAAVAEAYSRSTRAAPVDRSEAGLSPARDRYERQVRRERRRRRRHDPRDVRSRGQLGDRRQSARASAVCDVRRDGGLAVRRGSCAARRRRDGCRRAVGRRRDRHRAAPSPVRLPPVVAPKPRHRRFARSRAAIDLEASRSMIVRGGNHHAASPCRSRCDLARRDLRGCRGSAGTGRQAGDPPLPSSTCKAGRSASSRSRRASSTRGASRSCPTIARCSSPSATARARDSRRHARRRARVDGRGRRGRQRAQVARAAPALRAEPARLSLLSEDAASAGTTLAVARGRFDGTQAAATSSEIFVADAWETGGNMAGKIFFGPDETLYVTVGDRDRLCCTGTEDNSLRMKAQDLDNHVGKTLRIRDDGTRAARQSVRRPRRRQAGDLHLRPSQRLRPRVPSRDRRAVAGRDRADGRRRGQHPAAGPQLRLAARVDGAQLHRHARRPTSRFTATAWTTRGCSGCRRSARRA